MVSNNRRINVHAKNSSSVIDSHGDWEQSSFRQAQSLALIMALLPPAPRSVTIAAEDKDFNLSHRTQEFSETLSLSRTATQLLF